MYTGMETRENNCKSVMVLGASASNTTFNRALPFLYMVWLVLGLNHNNSSIFLHKYCTIFFETVIHLYVQTA